MQATISVTTGGAQNDSQLEEVLDEVIDSFDVDSLPTPDAVNSSRERSSNTSDSPPFLGVASGIDSEDGGAAGQGNWMWCCNCDEPRLVPRGISDVPSA